MKRIRKKRRKHFLPTWPFIMAVLVLAFVFTPFLHKVISTAQSQEVNTIPWAIARDIDRSLSMPQADFHIGEIPTVTVALSEKPLLSFLGIPADTRQVTSIELINPLGEERSLEFAFSEQRKGRKTYGEFSIDPSVLSTPGHYVLQVDLEQNGYSKMIEKDFSWGVLAVNVRRSVTRPNIPNEIGLAVLDDEGHTLCDADLTVTIRGPGKDRYRATTNSGSVHRNPSCADKTFTMEPDYSFDFTPRAAGTYSMRVVAETANGQHEITDSFFVQENPDFDVERTVFPTRIYPPEAYPVSFSIKPANDFSGTVVETVPADFSISEISDGGVSQVASDPEEENIIWEVDWQAGETYTLGYTFDAPDVSPEFYTLGPLRASQHVSPSGLLGAFGTPARQFDLEARQWQIASDAVTPTGRLYYGDGTNSVLRFYNNTYDFGFAGGEQTYTHGASGSLIRFIVAKPAITRDEIMIGALKADGQLMVIKGVNGYDDGTTDYATAWTTAANNAMTCEGTEADCTRAFDITYERLSGRAMVVYAGDSQDAGTVIDDSKLFYCYYDGTNWGPVSNCAPTTGTNDISLSSAGRPTHVSLKPKGGSNEILMGVGIDATTHEVEAYRWTGSAWTDQVVATDTTDSITNANNQGSAFDIEWESNSGDALVAYATTASSSEIKYKLLPSGGSWGSETGAFDLVADASVTAWVNVEADPQSDRIAIATNQHSTINDFNGAVWKSDGSTPDWTVMATDNLIEGSNGTTSGPAYTDVQWEQTGSEFIYVLMDSGAGDTGDYIRVTCSGTCSVTTAQASIVTTGLTDDAQMIRTAASRNSDDIMVLLTDNDNNLITQHWNGSAWESGDAGVLEATLSLCTTDSNGNGCSAMPATFTYIPYSPWSRNWKFFDGADTGNTPTTQLADENTTPTGFDNSVGKFRLRFSVQELSGMGQATARKKLQFTTDDPDSAAATWTDVDDPAGSAAWRYVDCDGGSSVCNDDTTLGGTTLSGSPTAGWWNQLKTGGTVANMNQSALQLRELEFSVEANTASIATYYFRMYDVDQAKPVRREQDNDGSNDCASATCTYPSLTTAAPGITVSGGCFTDEGEGAACSDAGAEAIKVAVNGTPASGTDGTVDGSWSFTIGQPGSGDILVFYIDGEATEAEEATTVIKYDGDGGNVTNVKMYQSQLVIGADSGSANSEQTITVADLDPGGNGFEYTDDEDVIYDYTAGADLVVDGEANKTEQLYVISGDTYQPASGGGSDTTTENLEIDTGAVITANTNAFSVSGNWDNNGTFTANSSTVTFTAADTDNTIDGGSGATYNNLTFQGSDGSGTWTLQNDSFTASGTINVDTSDILSINSGITLTHSGATLTLNGTISGSGRLTYMSSTDFPNTGTISSIVRFDTTNNDQELVARTSGYGGNVEAYNNSASARVITMGSAGGQTINITGNLTFEDADSGGLSVDGDTWDPTVNITGNFGNCLSSLDVTPSTGSSIWTVSGHVNMTNCLTTFTTGNTLVMNGTGTLTSYTLSMQNVTLSGTVTLANATHTIRGNLNMAGGTITAGSSTVRMGGAGTTLTGGSAILNNLNIDPTSAGAVTLQTSGLTVSGTLTAAASDTLTITGVTLTHTGTAEVAGTGTINGSGTLTFTDTSGGPGTTVTTLSSVVRFDATTASIPSTTVDARTYGGAVEFYSNVAGVRSITFPTGSFTFSSSFSVITGASQSSVLTVDASNGGASNPTIGIAGDLTYTKGGSATPAITSGTGTWTVSGHVTMTNGTYTATSGNTIVMNGTTKTFTSASNTVHHLTLSGSITLANATHTVAGNLTLGTITAGSSTVVMTGTANLVGNAQTLNNLTINGTSSPIVSLVTSDLTVSSTLTIGGAADGDSDTLTVDTSRTLTSGTAGTVTLVGSGVDTINGAGLLTIKNSNLGLAGTLSVDVRFDATSGNIVMPARTTGYGGDVEAYTASGSSRTVTMGTAGSQTINVTGNLTVNDSGFSINLHGGTWNPIVNITGNLGPCTVFENATITSGTSAWTVSGNVDFTGACIYSPTSGNTLVMDGSSKILKSGGFSNFYNLTVSGSVTAQTSSFSVTNTLNVSGTLSIDSGITVSTTGSGDVAGTGTISGAGTLRFTNTSGGPGTTLTTLSSLVRFDATSGDISTGTLDARTYGGVVTIYSSSSTARVATMTVGPYVFGGLTITAAGGATGHLTLTGATNDPNVTINGDVTATDGGLSGPVADITTGAGTWTLSGNYSGTCGGSVSGDCFTTETGHELIATGASKSLNYDDWYDLTIQGSYSIYTTTVVNNDFLIDGGTAAPSGLMSVAHHFTNNGAFTTGTSTVTMTGTSANIAGTSSTTFYRLTINPSSPGTITVTGSDITVTNNFSISSSDALTISSGRTVTHTGATLTLSGTVNGPGRLTYQSATAFPTGGVLAAALILRFDSTANDQTMSVRTDYQKVEIDNSSTTAGRTVTAANGTITLASTLDLLSTGADPSTTIFQLDTNDPTFTVTGATTIVANTTLTAPSGGALNINGSYTNNGTFTDSGGTVTFNGAGAQALAGTMTGSSDFNHVSITNTGGTVSLSNHFAAAGNFTIGAGATFSQGSTNNITLTGDTILIADTGTFTKASGGGILIMDGVSDNQTFQDANTDAEEDMGNVQIGQSPGTTKLKSDFAASSLTILTGDTFETHGWEVDISGAIDCQGSCVFNLTDSAPNNEGNGTIVTVGGNWTMSATGTFTPSTDSRVEPDGTADQTVSTGGKAFYNFYANNAGASDAVDDVIVTGTFTVSGALTVNDGELDLETNDPATAVTGAVTINSNGELNASSTGSCTVGGSWTNTGTFTANSGTVTFNGTSAAASSFNIDSTGASVDDFRNITFNDAADNDTFVLESALDVNGNLTITGGTLNTKATEDNSIDVGGNWTNADTFTTDGGVVTFDGSSAAASSFNIDSTGSSTDDFFNITFNDAGDNDTFVLESALDVNGSLTITGGTLNTKASEDNSINVAGNWTNNDTFTTDGGVVTFDGADGSTQILSGATTFYNFTASTSGNTVGRTLRFTHTTTYAVNGTWTITGFSGKKITLESSSAGTQWTINPIAASVTYVQVSDSNDTGVAICATFSTDTGDNNTGGWTISAGATCGIDFDGIAYANDNDTGPLNAVSVCVAVDNVSDTDCDTTNASGEFTISGVDASAGGEQLTFFIDGGSTFGNTVTTGDGSAIVTGDNLRIYQNHVVVRYEQGSPLTIVEMDAYDSDQNPTDILFDAQDDTPDTLAVEDGNELFVYTGMTFTPGGNATLDDIQIQGTYVATGAEAIAVSGSWDNNGTFTANSSTVTFDSGSTETVEAGASSFNAVEFANAAGTWTVQTNNMTTSSNLTLTSGTFTLESGRTLEVQGNYSQSIAAANTTWTGSTLYLNGSGGMYDINTKTHGGDTFATLRIGGGEDIAMWDSSATTFTIDGGGCLFSEDHGGTAGRLNIYGACNSRANEYWSYVKDWDGAAVTRQADVRFVSQATMTVDSGDAIEIKGQSAGANRTAVSYETTSGYGMTIGGTIDSQFYDFDYMNASGLNITSTATITELSDGTFDNNPAGATSSYITVSGITSTKNFFDNVFDDNTDGADVNVDYNVNADGASIDWTFFDWSGNKGGESFDNEVNNASVKWDADLTLSVSDTELDLGLINTNIVGSDTNNVTVTTNAQNGYTCRAVEDGNMRNGANDINDVSDGTVNAGSEEYGISCSGDGCQLSGDNGLSGSPLIVASSIGPTVAEITAVTYKAGASATTVGTTFSHIVTFTCSGDF